jgi:hypothetical protein
MMVRRQQQSPSISQRAPQVTRRALLAAAAIGVSILAGCEKSPSTPEEIRDAAFVEFLEKHVLNAPGLEIPELTPEQRDGFGELARHYDVIIAFHNRLNEKMETVFPQVAEQLRLADSLADLQRNWAAVETARSTLRQEWQPAFQQAYDQALTAKTAMVQSKSVQSAFSKAFDRCVAQPAATASTLLDSFDNSLTVMERMGHFLDDNKDSITVSGILLRANRPAMQEELNTLMKEFNTSVSRLRKDLAGLRAASISR